MKEAFIFIAKKLNIIGGLFIGFSLPFGKSIFSTHEIDGITLLPFGILLVIISYYYTFIYKEKT